MAYQKFSKGKWTMKQLFIMIALLSIPVVPIHAYSASDFFNDIKNTADKIGDAFKNAPTEIADRFKDTQATRALDFAARMAAYESALQIATGTLSTAKELSSGTLGASKATAQAGLSAAQGFLRVVESTSTGVLQTSGDAAKGVLEGAKQTSVGVLQGTTWVANQTLNQFEITRIHYDGSLQDLAKGTLGNVEVDARIVQPLTFHMTLDPKNITSSVTSVVNDITTTFKHSFIDPLTPKLAQVKQDESKIQNAVHNLTSLKAPSEIARAQTAARDVEAKVAHLTEQQLKLTDIARGTQKTLQDIQNKTYGDMLSYLDQKAATSLSVSEKRQLQLLKDDIVRKKLEANTSMQP